MAWVVCEHWWMLLCVVATCTVQWTIPTNSWGLISLTDHYRLPHTSLTQSECLCLWLVRHLCSRQSPLRQQSAVFYRVCCVLTSCSQSWKRNLGPSRSSGSGFGVVVSVVTTDQRAQTVGLFATRFENSGPEQTFLTCCYHFILVFSFSFLLKFHWRSCEGEMIYLVFTFSDIQRHVGSRKQQLCCVSNCWLWHWLMECGWYGVFCAMCRLSMQTVCDNWNSDESRGV